MYDTVIFDFDGVVIHSHEVQKCAFSTCYKAVYGEHAQVPYDEFFCQSGDSLSNIFKRFKIPDQYMELYLKISRERKHEIQIFDGMEQLLEQLNKKGIQCGLCTGKDRERTLEILDFFGIGRFFQTIVCSDDVVRPKPSGESLILALKNLNADINNAVMVGDGVNDIICAQNAGVESIGITWGDQSGERLKKAGADRIANSIPELKQYLLKNLQLMNDLVIAEKACNMNCAYCLTNTSNLNGNGQARMNYREGASLYEDLEQIFTRLREFEDTCILKISGGEVLLIRHIDQFIRKQAEQYKVIQILTNGTLLTEEFLIGLKHFDNICIQISLDHHTLRGNAYRMKDEKQLQQILKNLEMAVAYDFPVEINCVLTDRNTAILEEFASYLLRYKGKKLMLLPFPVRGRLKQEFFPAPKQCDGVRKLLDFYEVYKDILAPFAYLKELYQYLKTGIRTDYCYIPQIARGIFDDGRMTPCPNYWFTDTDNVCDVQNDTSEAEKTNKMYKLLISAQEKLKECRGCFTPWELFNLYVSEKLSWDDFTRVPLYSFPQIAEDLKVLKDCLKKGGN